MNTAQLHPAAGEVVVVIPTHGRDDRLGIAIDSVLAQSRPASQVVVVDDLGSSLTRDVVSGRAGDVDILYVDGSALVAKSAAASRNLGVRSSRPSELVAFLDDDDRWHPEFLERCVDHLMDSQVELVASWAAQESDGRIYGHAWRPEAGLRASDVFSRNPGVTGSNFVVRRGAFDAVGGFDAGQWVFNDLEFLVRFLDSGASYDVVRADLVVQSAGVGEHLSSRSDRRADGIRRYLDRYRPRMTRSQQRVLRRQIAVARMHPGRKGLRRLPYLAVALSCASPSDVRRAVVTRVRGDRGYG